MPKSKVKRKSVYMTSKMQKLRVKMQREKAEVERLQRLFDMGIR